MIEICGSFEAYAITNFGNSLKSINKALNALLEVDDNDDGKWLREFKAVGWKIAFLFDDVRQELEASWYKSDEVSHNIKFFRELKA